MLNEAHAHILRLINQAGPLSRTELVSQLGVSKASMSAFAAGLIERGMLTEAEMVYGSGRPSIRLALVPDSAFFIGVSLATSPFVVRATDLAGQVVASAEIAPSAAPETIVAAIADVVARMLDGSTIDRRKLAGIGIAVPGLIDAEAAVCIRSTLLGWRNVPIGAMVAAATGLPTFIENDANALALGQYLFGHLRGSDACTLVSVGDGIGCGHIIGGELHRGHRGGAGEIAHATIELNGLPCKCGKRGCLDTLASVKAIVNFAREADLPTELCALDEAAAQGDQAAIAILHRAGTALGLALSQIVQSLDPERIVVALGEGPIDGLYARVLRQAIDANVMPDGGPQVDLSMMRLDQEAWAIGAASVAAGRAFFRL
jgi:predicted NBD/HSP70 family sugar kinase